MAIFGRSTARQRLRRATRESLEMPAFSSPIDCGPWVTGGLWPAELSTITDENSSLAEYLEADLLRITTSANDELKLIKRAGLIASARQAAEARVINEARARAVRRVESTVRQWRMARMESPPVRVPPARQREALAPADYSRPYVARGRRDMQETQVMPAVRVDAPAADLAGPLVDAKPAKPTDYQAPITAPAPAPDDSEPTAELEAIPARSEPSRAPGLTEEAESDGERLERLLAFVAHQEPRLNWAIGDYPDGTTAVVTDLAHGWIPPGIALPAGVRLLNPDHRAVKISGLLGDTARAVTYAPGDNLSRPGQRAATEISVQPRELPLVEDPGWELSQATHWRDGLPRIVHTLAKAAAAGTGVVEEELDLLRVHLDTARYQALAQYPDVEPALLLNCLLLAATESTVTGDSTSANYHLAWFQKLNAPPTSRWFTTS